MSEGEQRRAEEICRRYVERLCACADRDPSLKDACDLARSQPDAVETHLSLLSGKSPKGPLNAEDRAITEMSLRKITAACVKADAALDPKACPRR